jgi:hypothetical protein
MREYKTMEQRTNKSKNVEIEASLLVQLFKEYSIKTELHPKRYDDRWHLRYIWKAKKAYGDNQGKIYESAWEGFGTVEEMLSDMVDTLPFKNQIAKS